MPDRLPFAARLRLPGDEGQQPGAQRVGCDEQRVVVAVPGVAGQVVEQVGDIDTDGGVGGEEPEVLVDPRGLRVVVAGPDVHVATQPAVVLGADDEGQLAMGLQPDQPVDDVAAGLLELAGPADVGLLVEPGLDLHDDQHLLAGPGRVDESVHHGRLAAGAVERELQREHRRVGRRLLDERLHAGRERVVGVLQQHVAAAQRGEDVAGAAVRPAQRGVGLRCERGGAQVRPGLCLGQCPERRQVQRRRRPVDLVGGDAELAHQQVQDPVAHVVGDLEPHRSAEPAPGELALQGVQQVLGVGVDLEVLVAGDPERRGLDHGQPREDLVQVGRDDVLEQHQPSARGSGRQQPGQQRRHLHPGEVFGAGLVGHHDREVQREPGDVRERVRRVDRQRREHRVDALGEHRAELSSLVLR